MLKRAMIGAFQQENKIDTRSRNWLLNIENFKTSKFFYSIANRVRLYLCAFLTGRLSNDNKVEKERGRERPLLVTRNHRAV